MSDNEYIKIDHVSKWFHHPGEDLHILDDVSFSVKKEKLFVWCGQIVGL